MAHLPKLRQGPRRRRAAAAEDRRVAMESLQESLERLEELDERVDALRARYQPWAYGVTTGEIPVVPPPFQAGAPALPSNTPGGVDAPSLEELMASSDRVGSYAQPEPKAATQRPCPHGPLPLAVVSDGGCTGMGEGGPAQRGVLPRPAVVCLPSAATGSASRLSHDPMLGA
jgi:hypothetical protein